MIISKSNTIESSTLALTAGTLSSGTLENMQDPDFSLLAASASATWTFTIAAAGTIQYIGLHGLRLPVDAVVTITGTSFSKSFTIDRDIKNLVFYVETAVDVGTLTVSIAGAGSKTISYIQAGLAATFSWGVSSGQSLHYLGKTLQERTSLTSRGAPIVRVSEETSPKLGLSFQNLLKSWVRTEFQTLLDHYDQDGILSILDYPEDNAPDESVAGFDLNTTAPTVHGSTRTLVNLSLSLRVIA